jgi:hypothetical protein
VFNSSPHPVSTARLEIAPVSSNVKTPLFGSGSRSKVLWNLHVKMKKRSNTHRQL